MHKCACRYGMGMGSQTQERKKKGDSKLKNGKGIIKNNNAKGKGGSDQMASELNQCMRLMASDQCIELGISEITPTQHSTDVVGQQQTAKQNEQASKMAKKGRRSTRDEKSTESRTV